MKKLKKISKKFKISPNLSKEFEMMWEGLTKKLGQKNLKETFP
jgi:hypothetical protein